MESDSSVDVSATSQDQSTPTPADDPNLGREELEVEAGGEEDQDAPTATVDAQSAVLGNDDLLNLIFSFQAIPIPLRDWNTDTPTTTRLGSSELPGTTNTEERKLGDLLKAALVCKTFFHPAMSALWRSMDSVVPLVKLIRGVVKVNDVLTTNRVISEEDLFRFDLYAHFVKRLVLSADALQDDTKDGCVAGHILPMVHEYRPQGLLPALKVLEVGQANRLRAEDLVLLKSMVSSAGTLTRLIIEGISSEGELRIASFLKSIHMKSPRLIAIALDDHQDWAVLDVVNAMNSLRSASLDLAKSAIMGKIQFQYLNRPMSNLVNLHLSGDLSATYTILCTVFSQTPQLKNLTLSLSALSHVRRNTRISLRSLVSQIEQTINMALESLVIARQPGSRLVPALDRFESHSFQKLRTLGIPLSIGRLETLFCYHHPSLVSLEIYSDIENVQRTPRTFRTSLSALKSIKNRVPNLKYLYIPIFLNTDDDGSLEFTDEQSNCHDLQEFSLKSFEQSGSSKFTYPESHMPSQKIADLLVIARHIDRLFPHLKKIDTKELRGVVEERWLDGFEAAVKQFGEQRRMLDCCRGTCRTQQEEIGQGLWSKEMLYE